MTTGSSEELAAKERQFLALVHSLQRQIASFQASMEVPSKLSLLKCQNYLNECQNQLKDDLQLQQLLNDEQKFTVSQILSEAGSFIASKLSAVPAVLGSKPMKPEKVAKYEDVSTQSTSTNDSASNDEIAFKILEQIEALKMENLKLQSITEKDLLLLDETDTLVEGNLFNMKQHNTKVALFASRAWKRTGLYWTIIFFSILLFFVSFMIIKIFPRPF